MDMTRTVRIRLRPEPETAALFEQTVQAYTSSFNEVARVGWAAGIASGVELHKATYYPERARTGLPAQLVCAAHSLREPSLAAILRNLPREASHGSLEVGQGAAGQGAEETC